MARFKKISTVVGKRKIEMWVNVNSDGEFTCSLPIDISEALGAQGPVHGKKADDVEHHILKLLREYDRLTIKSDYRIKYRIALSTRIKSQMPGAIMTNEAWRESSRIGSEYVPEESLAIIIDWFPLEIRLKGKEVVETRLEIPDEDDWYITNAEKAISKDKDAELYLMGIHKPYDGLVLVSKGRHWEFNDQNLVYRNIPLTKETFEFFSSLEGSFISMLTKLFSFLARDEKKLMVDIHKALQGNFFKQLGQ